MNARSPRLLKAKEFADAAGVTVRTLHLYDRLGLLVPAALTASGYRQYGEREMERLEHILALRFVGFNLEQIKELLQASDPPLAIALRMQRATIARRKQRLETAIAAIDEAQDALARDASADRWGVLRTVIEVFKMRDDWNWTEKFYTEEGRAALAREHANTPQEAVEQGQRDWAALIAEVEAAAARGEDPAGANASALAARWTALLAQFTKGNAEIQTGLNRLWSDTTQWPSDFKRPWSDAADAFIKKARNCES